jgi:hypothetical protein
LHRRSTSHIPPPRSGSLAVFILVAPETFAGLVFVFGRAAVVGVVPVEFEFGVGFDELEAVVYLFKEIVADEGLGGRGVTVLKRLTAN